VSYIFLLSALRFKVFVGNLPWEVDWKDLKDHMKQIDGLLRADVMMNDGGRSKGFGIAEYSSRTAAMLAITTLNGTELKGMQICALLCLVL
jgi:RNA recognition motif-containing protein